MRLDEEHGAFCNVTTQDFAWHAEDDRTGTLKNIVDLGACFKAYADPPARAWLIAIIKALIAEGG